MKMSDIFFQKYDDMCSYFNKQIIRYSQEEGGQVADPMQNLKMKKIEVNGKDQFMVSYGSMMFNSDTNEDYSKSIRIKGIPIELMFAVDDDYDYYCILEQYFDPKQEECTYRVARNQNQQIKVVPKGETCTFTMPYNEHYRKSYCDEKLGKDYAGGLSFQNPKGVIFDLESEKDATNDQTVYTFKSNDKPNNCIRMDYLFETQTKKKLNKIDYPEVGTQKSLQKQKLKKVVKVSKEVKHLIKQRVNQMMGSAAHSKKHQKRRRI